MLRALHAYFNLGSQLAWRIMKKMIGLRSPSLSQFLSFYQQDGIVPYSVADKDPAFSRCILCGLCDSLCPQKLGPSFFPMIARSIPDFALALPEDFDQGCKDCRSCEEICPEKVPLKKIMGFMKKKLRKGQGQ